MRKVGDPAEFAEKYDADGIDELLYLDVVASLYGRNSLRDLVRHTAERVYCPLTVGGGVRSVGDVRDLLSSGADKIAVNTAAVERPALIDEIALKFGSQALVVQIDAKQRGDGTYEAYTDGARQPSGKDAVLWAVEAADRGCGEILLTSIDREGTRRGCDLALVAELAARVACPVVLSGGVGTAAHVIEAIQAGASAVACAHVLHFGIESVSSIKAAMKRAGVPVRL